MSPSPCSGANMIDILQAIFAIAFLFSFAIFIHELGHFMFAKLFGVKVETFSIGFGKKLLKYRRGETEYCLSAIPFGGYVKMVGIYSKDMEKIIEGDKAATPEERGEATLAAAELAAPAPMSLGQGIVNEVDALRSKAWWQKFLVFSAGCINNFLTAAVVFFLMYWIGHYVPEPIPVVIEDVRGVDTSAVPLQKGDQIVSLEGKPVRGLNDLEKVYLEVVDNKRPGEKLQLEVVRAETTLTLELPVDPPTTTPLPDGRIVKVGDTKVRSPKDVQKYAAARALRDQDLTLGIVVESPEGGQTETTVSAVALLGKEWPLLGVFDFHNPAFIALPLPNLPAEKAGIRFGDELLAVDGQRVYSSAHATRIIRKNVGKTVPFEIRRGDDKKGYETLTLNVEVRPDPENPERGQVGIAFGAGPLRKWSQQPFGTALKNGFVDTYQLATSYLVNIKNLLFESRFQTIRENVGGPIAIGTQAVKTMQLGWSQYFWFFAAFNVILAVTNLLPLPVFDGGHIMFATIEAIIRRPLPAKFMLFVYNAFTLLIIGLAILIVFNDVLMNFWRWI